MTVDEHDDHREVEGHREVEDHVAPADRRGVAAVHRPTGEPPLARGPAGGARLARRTTAALLVVLGVGNAVLGVLVVRGVGSLLETAPATGWGLLAAGPLLAALGVWLWRDGVTAARTGFVVVVALLLANAATASQTEGAAGRTVLLILLALGCAASARTTRQAPEPASSPEAAS